MDLMDGRKAFDRQIEPGGDTPSVFLHIVALVMRAEADIEAAIDALGNTAYPGEIAVADRAAGGFVQQRAFDRCWRGRVCHLIFRFLERG